MLWFFIKPQREPLDMIEYLTHHAICCDWTCDWVSKLFMFNHILDYVSAQLVYLLDNLISSSIMTRSNSFPSDDLNKLIPIPYYFKLLWLWCSSLHLTRWIWWKTLPRTYRRILLVRPRPHLKYTRTLYSYIPGGFNCSYLYGMHRS